MQFVHFVSSSELGILAGLAVSVILIYLTVLWFLDLGPIGERPMLLLGAMICILSVQMVSFGVICKFFDTD